MRSVALDIESTLRRLLRPLFALLLLANLWVALKLCLHTNSFAVFDWLINYQGGFVRRGLIGEGIHRLAQFTSISPIVFVFALQAAAFASFLYFSYALLRRRPALAPFALLILSPFVFRFAIHDEQGSFRKEILFFALLAYSSWSVARDEDGGRTRRSAWISLGIYPLLVLSHEMLACTLPILVGLHLPRITSVRARGSLLLLVAISGVALFASLRHEVSPAQLTAIAESWEIEDGAASGALMWLGESSAEGRERVEEAVSERHYLQIYGFVLVAALLAFLPLRGRLQWEHTRMAWLGLLLSVVVSLPLFAVALDWGRFLNIFFVSAFLLCAATPARAKSSAPRLPAALTWLVLILYASAWHIPHCCGDSPLSRTVLRAWAVLTGTPPA